MDEIKVIWSDFSLNKIEDIAKRLEKKSLQAAQNVVSAIFNKTKQLETQPLSGTLEKNLIQLNLDHRFLLVYNYKLIYRLINKNTVYITDVFPTKNNPEKIILRADETE